MLPSLTVFTDGACEGNGQKHARGGMGIHFPDGQLTDLAIPYTNGACTNQKTELLAILIALQTIDREIGLSRVRVRLYTDSMYSINCTTKWVYAWLKNDWRTQKGTPVLNREYIEPIYQLLSVNQINLIHVEAHTGGEDRHSVANHRADRLAVQGAALAGGQDLKEPRRTSMVAMEDQRCAASPLVRCAADVELVPPPRSKASSRSRSSCNRTPTSVSKK